MQPWVPALYYPWATLSSHYSPRRISHVYYDCSKLTGVYQRIQLRLWSLKSILRNASGTWTSNANVALGFRKNTWYQRLTAQQSQYLALNTASTQSQYSVRITGGLVRNTHCVRDLVPNRLIPNTHDLIANYETVMHVILSLLFVDVVYCVPRIRSVVYWVLGLSYIGY